LKGIQAEHSKVESEFQLAILELEKKVCHPTFLAYRADHQFLGKYTPLYERRQAIISGKAEPTDGDVEAGKAADSDDEDDEEEEEKSTEEGADVKGIPEFWLTALKNAMPIAEQITDNDEEVSHSSTTIAVPTGRNTLLTTRSSRALTISDYPTLKTRSLDSSYISSLARTSSLPTPS